MRVANMNWKDIEAAAKTDPRCCIPIGSVEQHSYLSVCTDLILAEIGKEGSTTAFAEGVWPEGFNGFQPLAFSPTAPRAEMKKCMLQPAEFNSRSAKTHSGIHRDLVVRKRTTEVDHQPGSVAQIAHRHGIPTPKLNRLVELIHDIENGRRKMSADVFFYWMGR